MYLRSFRILLLGLLLGTASGAHGDVPDPRSAQVSTAIAAAEAGQFDVAQYPRLASHPLYGWVEYAGLRRNIDTLSNAQAQAFLNRYRGQAVAEAFREAWLAALSRREDWPAFRAAWSPSIKGTALRCRELNARQATGDSEIGRAHV